MARKCVVCDGQFTGVGRQITCSKECGRRRLEQKLKEHDARRKARREVRPAVACAICQASFVPVRKTNIYCSEKCAAEGLVRAIARQTRRREDAKLARLEKRLASATAENKTP